MNRIKKIELCFRCDEDWESMSPLDKGRHCASCKKQVIDFSTTTDKQILTFYETPNNDKICGRFRVGQLENLNEQLNNPQPKRKTNILHPIFTTALLATACSTDLKQDAAPKEIQENQIVQVGDSTHFIGKNEKKNEEVLLPETQSAVAKVRKQPNLKDVVNSARDTYQLNTQSFPETKVVGQSLMQTTLLEEVRHTAGVPLLTYELPQKKPPLHKRIFSRIKSFFSKDR